MKLARPRPMTAIPDASLADVAFLLMIFFISTTTVSEEYGLSLLLPEWSAASGAMRVQRRNVTVITTDKTGDVFYMDGTETPLALIRDLVRDRQMDDPELVVSVEPHPQAPYRAMVDILDELKIAGALRIALRSGDGG